MIAGTIKRRKTPSKTRQQLAEAVHSSKPLRVDREAGIIFGVKVLGLDSENGRRYTLEACRKSLPMYEGISVNIDHPKNPNDQRSSYDRFGRLQNIRLESDGIYGDLELLKTHPMAERVMEAAERMPEAFGLSHNAQGEGHTEGGVFVVESITDVRHVDLVADSATTKSLSESKIMATTLKQLFEGLKLKTKAAKDRRKTLLEADDMGLDEPMDSPAPVDAGGGDWKADLLAAIAKLLDSEDEDSIKKVDALMKVLKPSAPAAPAVAEGEGDEPDDDDKKKDEEKKKMEARIRYFEKKEKAQQLCESVKATPSPAMLKALLALDSEADQRALLEESKIKTPRSGFTILEGKGDVKVPADAKEFASLVLN